LELDKIVRQTLAEDWSEEPEKKAEPTEEMDKTQHFKPVEEPVQEPENRALAAAGRSDQGDKLPLPDCKVQVFDQCQPVTGIAKCHAAENRCRTVCLYVLNCRPAHFLFSQAMSQKAAS
jgi:hypothetical protein